ncbi:hypothetical protein D3C86_1614910 [compost metagenome]
MTNEGASLISSVLGLKVIPRTAIVFPSTSPRASTILSTILSFCLSLAFIVASIKERGSPLSWAILTRDLVSFGKQLPP